MFKNMRQILLICSLVFSSLGLISSLSWAADTIYQTVGPDGSVIFTDQPSKDAKEIKLKPITIFDPKEASGANRKKESSANTDPEPDQGTNYKSFTITSPANDATLQTGDAGNATVRTSINPALRVKKGHRLSALVDGTQLDYSTSASSIGLRNLNRGTHSVRAVIVNQRGDIVQLSSNSVTIHVKRASLLSPSRPPAINSAPPPVAAP